MSKPAQSNELKKASEKYVEAGFDWVGAAVIALIAVSILFSLFFRVVNVSGDSMNDTLVNGEKLLLSSADATPTYGDIVVIRREGGTPLIKRVIGLPGDEIVINDKNGTVYINDEPEERVYVNGSVKGQTKSKHGIQSYIVPEGGIFVLGDNRENSLDSRDLLDSITMDDVVGVVTHRMSPFESLRNGD